MKLKSEFNQFNPKENEILEGTVEEICDGIYHFFLRIRDENNTLWTTNQCISISIQIKDLKLQINDKIKLTYLGKKNNAHHYLLEKFENNKWIINRPEYFEDKFLEGIIVDIYLGSFNKNVLKIKDKNNKLWFTRQCKSLDDQIKLLKLKKDDYVQIIFNGRKDNEYQTYDYTIKLKGENMAWTTVKDLNETDKYEGTIYKPEVGDILEGEVVSVKPGVFKKLFLKIKDEDERLWITIQCGSIHNQIRKLAIKEGDRVQVEYGGLINKRHHYILRKWTEE